MELSKLSKKQKLELLDALEAKRQLSKRHRAAYKPHAGQLRVHASQKPLRYVACANGFGKTALAANEAIAAAEGKNPWTGEFTSVPAKVIVLLDSPTKVEETWIGELGKWTDMTKVTQEKKGKPYVTNLLFPNGSEITFMFHQQEPMIFESIELDYLICDEPPPRWIFIALMRGGRKKDSVPRFLIVGTPITQPWLRTELYEPWVKGERPDMDFFKGETQENEANLSEGYIENFAKYLTDKEKEIRLKGAFFDLDDLALAHLFDRKKHVLDSKTHRWPMQWPVVVVIDPAMAKKHVALMLGATKDNQLVALKELSYKGTAPEFGPQLKDWMQGYRVVDIVVDSLGSSDLSGGDGRLSFIASLQKQGIRCRATSYDEKQDEAWLSMIREVLYIPTEPDNFGQCEPRLKIVDTCRILISDIETASWVRYKAHDDTLKPKIDISKKDGLACLKYGLAAQPRFNHGNEKVLRGSGSGKVGLRNTDKTFRRS